MIEERDMREFAYLKDTAYLDVASVGLQPQRTLDYCRNFQQEFVDSRGRICFGPYGEMRRSTAGLAAQLIGADAPGNGDAGEILFTSNTTEGDSLLAACYPLKAGDSVLTCVGEYPSVSLGWAMKRAEGIRLQLVPMKNGVLDADEIIARMDDTTKVAAFSFVQFQSGFKLDLAKIGRACRERGILFLVDGIQGVGRNPVNVKEMCIDVLSCGAFKGLLGPLGTGFVYVRKEIIPRLTPYVFSSGNIAAEEEEMEHWEDFPPLTYREGIQRLEGGSKNTYGITAMGESIGLLLEIGIENIHAYILGLEREFRNYVREQGIPVTFLGAEEEAYWSGNICMRFRKEKTEELRKAFTEQDIYAKIEEGFLRLGLHFYNTQEHLMRAARVLQEVL
ncbi:MAG: aminotransferase class V-fold PLP-dependent enzyme [Eubacteriales bacterium]|nr:aminotransferase class V-fold PLP-dependent enzyme [Eubacteriales bacterium]